MFFSWSVRDKKFNLHENGQIIVQIADKLLKYFNLCRPLKIFRSENRSPIFPLLLIPLFIVPTYASCRCRYIRLAYAAYVNIILFAVIFFFFSLPNPTTQLIRFSGSAENLHEQYEMHDSEQQGMKSSIGSGWGWYHRQDYKVNVSRAPRGWFYIIATNERTLLRSRSRSALIIINSIAAEPAAKTGVKFHL